MKQLIVVSIVVAAAAAIAGFGLGYELHPSLTAPPVARDVKLTDVTFSCVPSAQTPYLEGALQFNLTSTYRTNIVASVAYTGDWTGDTNQLVYPNGTKHVAVTWGPGMMQNIDVTSCPRVGVVIWLIQQDLMACPNPPCDAGLNPAP